MSKKAFVVFRQMGFGNRAHLLKQEGIITYEGRPIIKVIAKPNRQSTLQFNPPGFPADFKRDDFLARYERLVERPHAEEREIQWL